MHDDLEKSFNQHLESKDNENLRHADGPNNIND